MDRRAFGTAGVVALWSALISRTAQAETSEGSGAPARHRVAIQVSSDDRKIQETALGNAHNYAKYYKAKGEPFEIEIVAFGPGYAMMRDDISMVKGNIETLQQELGPSVVLAACQNSRAALAASTGQKSDQIPQIAGVVSTPSGIVRLAELQEQGWSYIRP